MKIGYVSEDDKRINKVKFRDFRASKAQSVESGKN